MALNSNSVAVIALQRISARGRDVSGLHKPRIIALIPQALRKYSLMLARSEDFGRRNLYKKDFLLTITGGAVAMAPLLAPVDLQPALEQCLSYAEFFSPDLPTYPWQRVADRAELTNIQSLALTDFIYYCIVGDTIFTTAADGVNALTVRANYVPLIGTIKPENEEEFLQVILEEVLIDQTLGNQQSAAA